jgi:hypothetical protein
MAAHAFSRRMIDELALIGTRKAHEPRDVASWQILLQKSFSGEVRKF